MDVWGNSWSDSWGSSWALAVAAETITPPLSFHVVGGTSGIDVREHDASFNATETKTGFEVTNG